MSVKKRLGEIVGPENVLAQQQQLERYRSDESVFKGIAPSFIVRPAHADEIRKLIRLANREKMPVIPVSSGLHFNGTTLSAQGGMILDMGRMNRIIEVDIRNRRAMIEPGVRWGELQRHLRTMDMVAMNPLFPHPAQSVLTSYLERQPPIIPKFEYAEPILTLEVVLPTGDLLRTGSAASPGAPFDTVADMVCPYGPGLDFYRLFQGAQGTLGVVTWMNIKIEYFSPLRKTNYIQSDSLTDLLSFVHRVQRLMIGNECFILRRTDMAALMGEGKRDTAKALLREFKEWTGMVQMAGARWRSEERLQYQQKALSEISQECGLPLHEKLIHSVTRNPLTMEQLQSPRPEQEIYWKFLPSGACHDLAFHTTFERLPDILAGLDSSLLEHGYGPDSYGVYIQPLEYGRAYYCRLHLYFDPQDEVQIHRVRSIDEKLNRHLLLQGALFGTPYGSQASLTFDHAGMYTETLRKVKDIFDPQGIMNPGRLCF